MAVQKDPGLSPKCAVLFDLDGVIIDSETMYTEIWHKINLEFPTGVPGFETIIKGTSLPNILSTYFGEQDIPAVKDRLYELEDKIRYRYTRGARRLLADLREKGVKTALVTSSDEVKMSHLYEQLDDIAGYFDVIIHSGMITRSKPDPQGYLMAAEKLGADPGRCIVVEDSRQGAEAGRCSGAYVVGISSTFGREAMLPLSDIVVEGVDCLTAGDLVSTLNSLSR